MGIYNRDYMRDGGGSGPRITGPKQWSALTWLVVINVVVYIVQHWFIQGDGGSKLWGTLERDTFVKGHVHTLLTNIFIHADALHLLFNMILLVAFGRLLQNSIGSKRFLKLYLIAGIFAALISMLLLWGTNRPMIGASGAVLAIAIATCFKFGEAQFRLLFPPIPVKAKYIGWVLIGINVVGLMKFLITGRASFSPEGSDTGVIAHLIGAAIGYASVKISISRTSSPRKKKIKEKKKKPLSKGVDEILDKISEQGFQSLTKEEKRILDNRSEELSDNAK